MQTVQNQTENKEEIEKKVSIEQKKIPRIGIVGHMLPNGNSVGVTLPYLLYFQRFGNVKIINPVAVLLENDLDLLVLPGGPDVATSRYLGNSKEKHSFFNQKPDPAREWFDLNMLPQYIAENTPIFGICRGHQTIAVHFGSKLIQHLSGHVQNKEDERDLLIQSLAYLSTETDGNVLAVSDMQYRINVNSMHHQAVMNVPENASVAAWTSDEYCTSKGKEGWYSSYKYKGHLPDFKPDNRYYIIEALVYNNYPIASVQWHPKILWGEVNVN